MSAPSVPQDPPAKKRRRPALACEQCRRRKVRCDRTSPCNRDSRAVHIRPHSRAQAEAGPSPRPCHVGPVSILPAPAPTPPDSQCSTGDSLPVPASSTPVTVSESGVSDVHALGQRFEEVALANGHPPGSTGESIIGEGDEAANTTESIPKTRYYGRSHWMNGLSLLPAGFESLVNPKSPTGNLHYLLNQCKIIGRRIKESRLQSTLSINPVASPDRLLDLYVSSFEPVFPILHMPSFMADYNQYWRDPSQAATFFRVQLQLVLALGACLFDDTSTLRNQASRWVNEAQLWLLTPPEKSRMTLPGVQIMILLTLARSVRGAGQDTVWVLTGLLLRTAMYMGLHRDPSKLGDGKMTPFKAEMRRRLWLSILELNLQSAYDAGGAPLISTDDYDTLPPANLDDKNLITELEALSLDGRVDGGSTRLSVALALAQSLPLRLQILRHANNFRVQDSYSETLQLNSELVQACHQLSQTLRGLSRSPNGTPVTPFYASLAELLAYRCFHTLHQLVIVRSLSDPKYYFSQKMYIDGALKIAHISGLVGAQGADENSVTWSSPMTILHGKGVAANERLSSNHSSDGVQASSDKNIDLPDALFTRLLTNGAGMFRNTPIQATLGIILEFVSKWGGKSTTGRASSRIGCLPGIHSTREADFAALTCFLNAVRGWTLRRIRSGEVSIKGHYFLTCYLRHVSAIEDDIGKDLMVESVVAGAVEAAEVCLRELKSMAEAQELSLDMSLDKGFRWTPRPESTTFLDPGLNVSEFGDGSVDAMDMDWMGGWLLDGMTEFANFSWGINTDTMSHAPYA